MVLEQNDFRAQPDYNYTVTERDDDGPAKTYQQLMLYGSPYRKLTAVNGRALSPAERSSEEDKLRKEIARRRRETKEQRAERISRYAKNRDQEHAMLSEMIKAFNYKLSGESMLDGRQVYVLHATPRPGYEPPNTKARVLKGMRGTLWIDVPTHHWVKVYAEVVQPVDFYGFLARVGPGTSFDLEKKPVANNIWLPSHFAMEVRAKIIGLFSHNQSEEDRFYDYQPVGKQSVAARLR